MQYCTLEALKSRFSTLWFDRASFSDRYTVAFLLLGSDFTVYRILFSRAILQVTCGYRYGPCLFCVVTYQSISLSPLHRHFKLACLFRNIPCYPHLMIRVEGVGLE